LDAREVYALETGFKDQTEQISTTGEVSIPEEKGELFLKVEPYPRVSIATFHSSHHVVFICLQPCIDSIAKGAR
jgi:hypothetical protein